MAKILVIIDPDATEQTALLRCTEMAPAANLEIHVVRFIEQPKHLPKDDTTMATVLEKAKEDMDPLVANLKYDGYHVTTDVLPFVRLYEAIIQTAASIKADFVFKPLRKHSAIARTLFTSTDWNLIRLCPLPLLLTSNVPQITGRPVVAAIDVCNSDPGHEELNRIVLSQANVVGRTVQGVVHAVNAFHTPTAVWGNGVDDPVAIEMCYASQQDHLREAVRLSEEFGIPQEHVTVAEGAAERVVNDLATELSAGLIVLGTVARSGLSGLFIGNTAEAVLEHSNTDVMVVKQVDFKSPIAAAA